MVPRPGGSALLDASIDPELDLVLTPGILGASGIDRGCSRGSRSTQSGRPFGRPLLVYEGEVRAKPFLSTDGQVELLNERGVQTDGHTAATLLREGYYSVINGYKSPFIDEAATKRAGDDRYKAGTRFSDIYELFDFDRHLRETTFHYLVIIEAEWRTIVAHTFSEAHPAQGDYLLPSNFATRSQYRSNGFKNYDYDLSGLLEILSAKAHESRHHAIAHYRATHGSVPLWVLSNDLTFGNVEHFYNLMRPDEQRTVCKRVALATHHAAEHSMRLEPRDAILSLDTLVKARNMCAHDERLYCASIGGRRHDTYGMMLRRMRKFLTDDEFGEMARA